MEMRWINRDSFWARAEVPTFEYQCDLYEYKINTVACFEKVKVSVEIFLFPVCQREEEARKEDERRRAADDRRRRERERVLQERKEAEERDRKMNEKLQMIEEQR